MSSASDQSDQSKLMNAFFTRYSENNHYPIVNQPPTINNITFMSMIQSYHARERMQQRVGVSEENMKFFKDALDTRLNRCFFDLSTKIFEIDDSDGNKLYYHFTNDLQKYINFSSLGFHESQNIGLYKDYETAYDDALLAEAVLEKDTLSFPLDFVKQITMKKTYFYNDSKALLIIPKDTKKPCWKLIFNKDFTKLVTVFEYKFLRTLFDRFQEGLTLTSGTKSWIQTKTVPITMTKKRVPSEWLSEWSPQQSQPQVQSIEKKKIMCIKCGNIEFNTQKELDKHKRTKEHITNPNSNQKKYFSVDEMYKQKYLKYKSKYLKMKEFLQ